MLRPVLALLCMLALSPAPAADLVDWQSPHDRGNALVGTVWRGDGTASDVEALARAARAADFVLVGETHPNPDHHLIQARLIGEMVAAGRRPAIVFEMIPENYRAALEGFLAGNPRDASGLGALLDWEKRGWPDWRIYRPVAEAAIAADLAIVPGALDRQTVRDLAKSGPDALDERERLRLGLDWELPPALADGIAATLRRSHCGLLPEPAISGMIGVQRARDGFMAAALAEAGGGVLIAGSGHARRDFSVPLALARMAPGKTALGVAIVEVEHDHAGFADYADSDGTLPYDYVVFTPRFENTDHCEELRKRMGTKGE